MPTLPLLIAPGLLLLFMMALAVVPLALVWMDERRRVRETERLVGLRRDAALQAMLARQSQAEAGPPRGIPVTNA